MSQDGYYDPKVVELQFIRLIELHPSTFASWPRPSEVELLATAQRFLGVRKLKSLEGIIGRPINTCSARSILDWVYGADVVFQYENRVIGVDVTLSPVSYRGNLPPFRLSKAIGIDAMVRLFLQVDFEAEEPQKLTLPSGKPSPASYHLAGDLMEVLDAAPDGWSKATMKW